MQHQASIRHILNEPKVQEEIFVAYKLFRLSRPAPKPDAPFDWKSPTHRCTASCQQFFHCNVCICEASGNWHYCTQDTCNERIRTRDSMVCPLSGNTYDLELEWEDGPTFHAADDLEDDHKDVACDDYGAEETADANKEATKTTTDVTIPSELCDISFTEHRLRDIEQQHEKTLREESRRRQSGENEEEEEDEIKMEEEREIEVEEEEIIEESGIVAKPDDVHNRYSVFHQMLSTLFKAKSPPPHALFSVIIANAERLWIVIHTSPAIRKKQFRYQPSYHMLAILTCMCTGYKCANKVVVPQNEWIRERLPLTRDIHKLGIRPPIKVPSFTQTKKLFQRCIANVASKQNIQWNA